VKVVSLMPFGNEELAALLDSPLRLVVVPADDQEALRRELAEAQIVIASQFDRAMAALCPRLRLLQCPAAGTDRIDREALPPGVQLANGGGHEIPIAEYVIGALVALRQQLLQGDRALRRGEWHHGFWSGRGRIGELHGSTLGLLGLGGIGREVARRAAAFGMTTRALTLHPDRARSEPGLDAVGPLGDSGAVDDLVASSDAIAICCELSPLTRDLIDARRLDLMKRDAVLVNVARGPIVNEQALFEALRDGRIAGAALDVWYRYPERPGAPAAPSSLPFGELENVIMSPHTSGWTAGQIRRKLEMLAANLNAFAASGRVWDRTAGPAT